MYPCNANSDITTTCPLAHHTIPPCNLSVTGNHFLRCKLRYTHTGSKKISYQYYRFYIAGMKTQKQNVKKHQNFIHYLFFSFLLLLFLLIFLFQFLFSYSFFEYFIMKLRFITDYQHVINLLVCISLKSVAINPSTFSSNEIIYFHL